MNRRKFIKNSAAIISAGSLLQQCTLGQRTPITGSIVGAHAAAGHLVRNAVWQDSTDVVETGTVIIGGGVSGLSAARWLQQEGHTDFMVLELDKQTGGNAASGKNETSAYPWGAHYVPLPNNDLAEYLAFLEESGVITGYDEKNLPYINEYYLCFEPQERLYINGYWQEGLVPDFGVPAPEQAAIRKFLGAMSGFRAARGRDGKEAFAIPVDASSQDELYRRLDSITMHQWLKENGYDSPYLSWYVNYCCRDDFGTDYRKVSAWAGIHYFAGRKGLAANAPPQSVITWPEGNAWLVAQLRKNIVSNIVTSSVATKIRLVAGGVEVCVVDANTRLAKIIRAKKCIVATPQFVAARLLDYPEDKKKMVSEKFIYQPWMVANITTGPLDQRNGETLSWDNVLYNSKALGYVEATHQHLQRDEEKKVLTYYYPLTVRTAAEERKLAYERSYDDWVKVILEDLAPAHKDARTQITNIDVWVWGHAMISATPGFIHGVEKQQLQLPVNDTIFFAHTDLAGISIFEEAFYQGIKAARQLLQTT